MSWLKANYNTRTALMAAKKKARTVNLPGLSLVFGSHLGRDS
jgi:hypothetical protein